MDDQGSTRDIEDETLRRIRERTLQAESEQLHMRRPHKIIPEIRDIVEEEIPE
jgi:DNA replication initiation complex subunit (GINS family)